ncbi:sulfur-oxidizing protein SoxY [Poseidonocella pacifica]|uniref:Sulfur-oxidizing protein SoxY n=1 Tax=Poseidonocella pacifica TaxID=871651 RepID=A0A1I0YJ25_9RHOB|nr:quinoprotein dehydrogenase-associated SoxYZ-like carrier [Poseidonocella pacifica]SFB12328.1 sulfur-oxidizing protein SoxY [Poseidonocella pacifica]
MKLLFAAAIATGLATPLFAEETIQNPLIDSESWTDMKYDILGDIEPAEGNGVFSVDAPYRAHDAATVPVVIRQTNPDATIQSVTVVIDENPAPLAAEVAFGAAMVPLDFELRVRVNQYSNVRVIATTDTGSFMTGRFVKASGGCSAPATKDPALALNAMGQMKLRQFGEPMMSTARREAQIMIRHPNYSGLQRDQVTHLFIPAHFIDELEVRQGDDLLFTMTGGISISENPVFRFGYSDNGAPNFHIRARDTEGNVFEQTLPKTAQG